MKFFPTKTFIKLLSIGVLAFTLFSGQAFATTYTTSGQHITTQSLNYGYVFDSVVNGNYLYSVSTDDALTVTDITDIENPTVVTDFVDAVNLNGARAIKISGNYAYIGGSFGGVFTSVDISNPASPVVADSLFDASGELAEPYDIEIEGTTAIVINNSSSTITTIDITDPQNMAIIDSAIIPGSCNIYNLEVQDGYAYIAGYNCNYDLHVYDISSLGSGSTIPVTGVYGMNIIDSNLFLSIGVNLGAYDITSTPGSPVLIGSPLDTTTAGITSYIDEYVPNSDFIYINGSHVVDISNLSDMSIIGTNGNSGLITSVGEYTYQNAYSGYFSNVYKTIFTASASTTNSSSSHSVSRRLAFNWIKQTNPVFNPSAGGALCATTALLAKGSTGSLVSLLQTTLGNLLVDGMFGSQTEAGVRAYQTVHNLSTDGVVGTETRGALCK